jgi:hypothetical protein
LDGELDKAETERKREWSKWIASFKEKEKIVQMGVQQLYSGSHVLSEKKK